MTLSTRLNARLGLTACLLGLTVAVPAIALVSAPAPAEARAGGSYGSSSSSSSSSSSRSSSSSSRSSYSGSRSSSWSSSRSYSSSRGYSRSSRTSPGGFLLFLFLAVSGFGLLALLSSAQKPTPFAREQRSREQAKLGALLAEAAQRDSIWREDALLQHARDAFEAVQRAWVARDQDLAQGVMTPALYQRHKAQTDAMIARGERNVLGGLEITAARIVHLADRLDDDQDAVWIQFTASAEDYLVSEQTGKVLKGAKGERSVFKEVWKFKREGRVWKVDAIDGNIAQVPPASFSETHAA